MNLIQDAEAAVTTNPYAVLVKWGLVVSLVLGALGYFSHVRYAAGEASVQAKWDAAKAAAAEIQQQRDAAARNLAARQDSALRDASKQLQDALNENQTLRSRYAVRVVPNRVPDCPAAPRTDRPDVPPVRPQSPAGDAGSEVPGLGQALIEDANLYPVCRARLHTLIQACLAAGCSKPLAQ